MTSSIIDKSTFPGMNPAPIPWMSFMVKRCTYLHTSTSTYNYPLVLPFTCITSSIIDKSTFPGMNPAPIP